ncbi:MAG: hypothetical protein AAF986_01305 [Pseudomonadota bacterium]
MGEMSALGAVPLTGVLTVARYDEPRGGIGRTLITLLVAGALGAVAFLLGRMGAGVVCDGPCEALLPLSEMVAQPFPIAGDKICWLMALVGAAGLVLWFALASAPAQTGLASIAALGIIFLGALLPKGISFEKEKGEPVAPPPPPVSTLTEEPASLPVAEPEPVPDPECPAGLFWNGEGCVSCTVARTEPKPASLYFSPLAFEATWQYADDRHYVTADKADRYAVTDLVVDGGVSAGGQAVCASGAILVIGSASSDGPRARNLARAARRAKRLADRVGDACPANDAIFALSLGQSLAPTDEAGDRAVTVIGLDTPQGQPVTQSMLAEELSHVLHSQTHGAPLLTRYQHFPQDDWEWVGKAKTPANIVPAERPFHTVDRLRDDAPEQCLANQ